MENENVVLAMSVFVAEMHGGFIHHRYHVTRMCRDTHRTSRTNELGKKASSHNFA